MSSNYHELKDVLEQNTEHPVRKLSKREKKALRKQARGQIFSMALRDSLKDIEPITPAQDRVFEAFDEGKHLVLHGYAGTGKSFISLYLCLDEILRSEQVDHCQKLTIIRSTVATRDLGYLPGSMKEKIREYETPYKIMCDEMFQSAGGGTYDLLKSKDNIEFVPTSFLRGTTLNDTFILVDEINNMTFQELDTIITRAGKNSTLLFCGDYRQSDLTKDKEKQGLLDFLQILKSMHDVFEYVEFNEEDIIRSDLVRKYIIAKTNFESKKI